MADTHRDTNAPEEAEPEVQEEEKGDMEGEGEEGEAGEAEEDAVSEYTDGGTKIEKKAVIKEEPKRDFSNRISSSRDQMIELDPQNLAQAQSSTACLCFSNFNQKFIAVQTFDLKTSRRLPVKMVECQAAPTKLFQLDDSNILVGREDGKIDHCDLKATGSEWVNSYDGNTEQDGPITIILELKTKSKLVRDAVEAAGPKDDFRLIVTASGNSGLLRFWKLDKKLKMHLYMEIHTSLVEGVGWLVEMTDTQLIAASSKNIKIMNFVNKLTKEENESASLTEKEKQEKLKSLYSAAIDNRADMKIDKANLRSYFVAL